jgi:hypothetical protein
MRRNVRVFIRRLEAVLLVDAVLDEHADLRRGAARQDGVTQSASWKGAPVFVIASTLASRDEAFSWS